MNIGVLAMQGAVAEHIRLLNELPNVHGQAVRTIEEINQTDGIIIPGGESTTISKLLDYFKLNEPLRQKINHGFPVWGTCAGLIMLANKVTGQPVPTLQTMDMTVRRNAYGSQLDSFQITKQLPKISAEPLPLVFIRAPYIESVGKNVEILAEHDNKIIAARENNMLATAFHPELTSNLEFHRYFCEKIVKKAI